MKQLGLTAIGTSVLALLFATYQAHAITRAEIIEGYKTELKQAYNNSSLNPAVTALCKSVARSFTIFLEDTNNLDYDLDEKQNKYYVDTTTQLELDANVRGDVTWRIFRDACKAEVGYYIRTNWKEAPTEQQRIEREAYMIKKERYRACENKIVRRGSFNSFDERDNEIEKVCGPEPLGCLFC